MDVFGKVKLPDDAVTDVTSFQETFEALLRYTFENIGLVSIGKGFSSESSTTELHLQVAHVEAETHEALMAALYELFGPFSVSFYGTDLLVEQAGFTSRLDAFVAQRLQWRTEASAKAEEDARFREQYYSDIVSEDDSEEWRNIYDSNGLITDRIMAD